MYAVTPVAKPAQSPFANAPDGAVRDLTSNELLRLAREEGWARGKPRALSHALMAGAFNRYRELLHSGTAEDDPSCELL